LADVMVSLNVLSDNAGGLRTDAVGQEDESAPAQLPWNRTRTAEIDFSWEEEIDISVPGESPADSMFSGNYGEELVLDEVAVDGADASGTENNFEPYTLTLEDMVTPSSMVPGPETALPSELPLEKTDSNVIADSAKAENDFFASLNWRAKKCFPDQKCIRSVPVNYWNRRMPFSWRIPSSLHKTTARPR